jgi:hypothetical protein
MRVYHIVGAAVATLLVVADGAQAQEPTTCPATSAAELIAQDACQKAVDIFQFMAPQLGVVMAGGNATMGTGGALGGIGRFSVGIRANGLQGRLPRVQDMSIAVTGREASDFPIDDHVLVFPSAEVAFGLFRGIPLGVTNVLALDALVNVSYVPDVDEGDFELAVDQPLKLGFGGRVGLLQESFVTPSIAVTYIRRDLPSIDLVARSGTDEFSVSGFEVETSAWRVVAGKSLAVLGLALGGGQDRYDSRGSATARLNRGPLTTTGGPISVRQKLTRTNLFADVSLNFPLIKIAAEIGRASGGDIETFNTFSGKRADDALIFGSLGFRIGF